MSAGGSVRVSKVKLQGEFDAFVVEVRCEVGGRMVVYHIYAWTCPHCYRDFFYLTPEQLLFTIREHLKRHERVGER